MSVQAMVEQLARRHGRLSVGGQGTPAATGWCFAGLAGRLVEVSGAVHSAALTAAVALVAEAQRAGDVAAWVSGPESVFYPPDAPGHGVDLAQLAVVRAPQAAAIVPAGVQLARCGGFGLVVLDLAGAPPVNEALLGRLGQAAQRHGSAVLCLTRKPGQSPSLGSLVALRAEASARRAGPDRFACSLAVLKDKRHGAGWRHEEVFHGPPGLH